MERVITANWHVEKAYSLSVYQQHGGFKSLKKVFGMERGAVVPELIKSNLRGRGGAGFPVGAKWSFLPKGTDVPKYLVVNADEGEPGTFKDRFIMERDPHRLMEGCIIAGYTLGLKAAYIYVRGELVLATRRMEAAIAELYATGLLGKNIQGSGLDFDIYVHRGAGAYICGEETALIESLEGKTGQPRLKPPFPAVVGVFGCPTVVNNVESIACVPLVIERGAEWWAAQGSEKNGGPKIVQISGKVKRPGTYEVPNGISLRDIVFSDLYGGGPLDGNGRRSIYTAVRRNFLSPMMLAFDSPIPFTSMGRRNVSNVPAQALILMNDPFIVEQAKLLAKKLAPIANPTERVRQMYLAAFSRPPTPEEIADANTFLTEQRALHAAKDADERAWADFAHVLFNVKEFIYLN